MIINVDVFRAAVEKGAHLHPALESIYENAACPSVSALVLFINSAFNRAHAASPESMSDARDAVAPIGLRGGSPC